MNQNCAGPARLTEGELIANLIARLGSATPTGIKAHYTYLWNRSTRALSLVREDDRFKVIGFYADHSDARRASVKHYERAVALAKSVGRCLPSSDFAGDL